MKILKSIDRGVDTFCGILSVFLLGALVIVVSSAIVFRTWFTALSWSEEATKYLLIWSTYIGATCVYRRSGNISITVVQGLFPEKVQKWLRILVHVICLMLFVVLTYYGHRYFLSYKRTTTSFNPYNFSMRYVFMVIPFSTIVMSFHAIVMILEELFDKKEERN